MTTSAEDLTTVVREKYGEAARRAAEGAKSLMLRACQLLLRRRCVQRYD